MGARVMTGVAGWLQLASRTQHSTEQRGVRCCWNKPQLQELTRGPRRFPLQGRMGVTFVSMSSTDREPVVVLISVFTTAPKAQLTE